MGRAFRRLLTGLLILCALAQGGLVMPSSTALAAKKRAATQAPEAQALSIDFSISPGELVAPGDVTMTFTITNRSGQEVQNIYLTSSDGLLSEPIGQIGPGETQTLVRPHALTQAELDDGEVRYTITHDAVTPGGEKVSYALSAPVTKGSARPDVDFTRQLSSLYVAPGGQLTITYRLTNKGNVPASAIAVRDTLGDFTGRLDQLEVGASKTFISRVTVSEAAQSEATLEYTVPSGETFTRALDPVEIHLSDSALEAAFSVGRSVFDPDRADAILTLTNTGNDDYTDITVLDDVYGGVIADSISLASGSHPFEVAYTYPVRGSGEYRWRVTGVSQAGEALDFVTETMTLVDDPTDRTIGVALKASARTPRISRAGYVNFDLEISNTGTAMAQGLRLYEVERGEIRSLAVLPTGAPIRCPVSYEVTEDSQFIFCLSYTDAEGRVRTVTTAPVTVTLGAGGVDPVAPDGSQSRLRGASVKPGDSATFVILLAVASAALVSMITILLVTSLRARQERRRRLAEQRRRQRAGQDRVRPAGQSGRRRRKPGASGKGVDAGTKKPAAPKKDADAGTKKPAAPKKDADAGTKRDVGPSSGKKAGQ